MTRPITSTNAAMTAFLMGSLIGIAAGLLFAPRSGRESREVLRNVTRDKLGKMQQKVRQGRDAALATATDALEKTKEATASLEEVVEAAKTTSNTTKSDR